MFLQDSAGFEKELKKWVVEFQNYRNETRESLAGLSSEMRVFKDQLQTTIDLLQLTARKVSPNAETTCPPTSATSTQEDQEYIIYGIFGTNPDFDQCHKEREYEDI